MQTFSLLGFVAHLGAVERDLHEVGPAIVARACELVCAEAKRVIGEGYADWPKLQPDTIAEKVRQGYFAPAPLLRTGELRESIEWTAHGLEGQVGSNNDKAVWHELGTSRVPPRSFLAETAMRQEEKIHRMAERAVVAVLMGGGLHSAEMRELLHLLKHAYHSVKETIEDVLEDPDEKEHRK